MTKHSKKRRSFVPPEDHFDAELQFALKPGVLKEVAHSFTPVNEERLLGWVRSFVLKTRADLKTLYVRHRLSPVEVLTTVVMGKTWSLRNADYLNGWLDPGVPETTKRLIEDRVIDYSSFPKLRSFGKRDRDARLLEKAARCLDEWKPILLGMEQMDRSIAARARTRPPASFDEVLRFAKEADSYSSASALYPSSDSLRDIARRLRAIGPSKRHRPKKPDLIHFARYLAFIFRRATGDPLYEYVGRLLHAALPESWNPAGDLGEAAKKLVKSKGGFPLPIGFGSTDPAREGGNPGARA